MRRLDAADLYLVTDRYIDIVVEGMGPTYRMLDLNELGQALTTGALGADEAREALEHAQRFVDTHLHRGAPFPPAAIHELFSPDHRYPPPPQA